MAGLMDVNILKPELAGSFEAGYRGAEQARQQSEMNQLKLDQLKQDRAMLTELQTKLRAAGQSDDPNQFFRAMIQTGNPDYMAKGYEGLQRYKELQRAEQLLAGEFGGAPAPANALVGGAAPAAAGAPTGGLAGMTFGGQVGPAPAGLKVSPEDKAYQQAADQWMMGGMQGPAPTRAGAAPANALAPAPGAEAAPANAMVGMQDRAQELRRKIMAMRSINDPRMKAMADQYENELKELTKTHTVGGRIVSGTGKVLYEAPPETSDIKEYEYAKKNQGFKGSFIDFMQIKPSAGAARQVMQVNTQLPASEEAQKEFMKEMRQTYSALKQAPTVLDNIEKAKALVPQAKGFMGAGGEGVLQAASFLNNRLGTSINTQGVKSAEELRSRLFLGIMDNLKKLDSQPSQQQQAALQQALGSIGTDPNALPRVLDVFGDTIRQKVDLYNEEASSAESRGVKFPYKPTITLKPRAGAGAGGAGGGAGAVPAGVDPALWNVMTPQERALWRK